MNRETATGPAAASAPQAVSLAPGTRSAGSVAVVVLVDFKAEAVLWGWSRLVLQRWPLRHVAGLKFCKVLGSGFEGGFGLRPSRSRQGLFLGFDSQSAARQFVDSSALLAGYRARARELCVAMLRACSSRGSWSGASLDVTAQPPPVSAQGAIASLTRASIRPACALQFWRMQPASEAALKRAPGVLMATGVGEAPLLRQATFTLWQSVDAMNAYARSGAHQAAIQAARSGGFFSESMFVRFVPLELRGTWQGVSHG